MGQKINPNGFRFGINKNWESRWVAISDKQMAKWIIEDEKIRNYFIKTYPTAQVVRTEIERTQSTIDAFVYVGQPGVIIGKEGENLTQAKLQINKIVGRKISVNISIIAYDNPGLSARLIAREIADAIENRVSFRNAQKMAVRKVLAAHAKGVRTHVSGRLGGVEMAREEGYSEGIIPLTTLRADIDYAIEEAHTTYGLIGVKVWINRGEIFNKDAKNQPKRYDGRINNTAARDNDNRRSGYRRPQTNTSTNTSVKTEAPSTVSK